MALLLMSGSPDAEAAELSFEIRNHRFVPEEMVATSGEKIRLSIYNRDTTPEEFESYELNREKVVSGNSSIRIFLPALEPGIYPFFGEFHPETAQGRLIVK